MAASSSDADLTPLDWILAIFCGMIGCIVSIVYIAQGKPKGTKMLIINIVVSVILGGISAAAQVFLLNQVPQQR